MRLCFLLQEHLANLVVFIHQRTQIVPYLDKYVVRIGLGYLLNPLYFFVVLDLLGVCWVLYFAKLRLQIVQYAFYFPRSTFNVLV
jgi:hypothetical protein